MTIKFNLGNSSTSVPGVYSDLTVRDNLLNQTASPRNILIVGEATEGAPASQVDMRANFFTDFPTILDTYKSGPIVDAARQLFTTQPATAFTGSIGSLYIAKTNQSTKASRALAGTYGTLSSFRFGEDGNKIKTKVVTVQSKTNPGYSTDVKWSAISKSMKFTANGVSSAAVLFNPKNIVTTNSALSVALTAAGMSFSGGTIKTFTPAVANLTVTAVSNQLTIVSSASWLDVAFVGESVIIPDASPIAGAGSENVGVYKVVSFAASSLVIQKVQSWNAAATADVSYVAPVSVASTPVAGSQQTYATSSFFIQQAYTFQVTAPSADGQASTLIISEASGSSEVVGQFSGIAQFDVFSESAAASGSLSAVASGSTLDVSVTFGSFQNVPKSGDMIEIPFNSPIAGPLKQNVGRYVVQSSGSSSMSLVSAYGIATLASVVPTPIANLTSALQIHASQIASTLAGRTIYSSAERKVKIEANHLSNGSMFTQSSVGGQSILDLSWFSVGATSASVTIDQNKVMTITVGGSTPQSIRVILSKYESVGELVLFLNTIVGLSAKAASTVIASLPTSALDEVQAVSILSPIAQSTYPARILSDFYSFSKLFSDNGGFIEFKKGANLFKSGLPADDATALMLVGGTVGATSNADVQSALDSSLKTPVRMVIPLLSRDARFDIEDGLTDEASAYTIESVNAAVKSHVATGWQTTVRRKRIGLCSIHESFENAKEIATQTAYEYISFAHQMTRTANSQGAQKWFAPWMIQCNRAAGFAQSALATSMLNKSINSNDVKHIGAKSLFDATLARDFDPDNRTQLESAIDAGLVSFGLIPGSGVAQLSPDVSSRSRINDPKAYFYERSQLHLASIEILDTCESVLLNRIGSRQPDVSTEIVKQDVISVLTSFVNAGAIVDFSRPLVTAVGVGYKVLIQVKFAETLEFIKLDLEVTREIT